METNKRFFRKMTTPIILVAMTVLFTACPKNKPIYFDLGRIPEQYQATVPYQNGDLFRMKHETSKVIIDFEVSRHRLKETNFGNGPVPTPTRFQPAPTYYYDFEVDQTVCKPKYPIFNINITFSNEFMINEDDAPSWLKSANIYSTGSARFPLFGEDASGYEILDSLVVNGHYYRNVFKLESSYIPYYDYSDEMVEQIHVETFFYNYENGIIGILMSNGEKYWLYED